MANNKLEYSKKKRVVKACDSCRLKKTKCNGQQPCERCSIDDKICIYTERRKTKDKIYSSEHVELMESRLDLVNKSFVKLCELIKLDDKAALDAFKSNLTYNPHKDSHISINQAISLLGEQHNIHNHSDTEDSPLHNFDFSSPTTVPTTTATTTTSTTSQPFFDIIPAETDSTNPILSPLSAPLSDSSSMLFSLNESSNDFSMLDSSYLPRSSSSLTTPSLSSIDSVSNFPRCAQPIINPSTLDSLGFDIYPNDDFVHF